MSTELATISTQELQARLNPQGLDIIPEPIADAGPKAAKRFLEFFAVNIRNLNTRKAYHQAALS